MKYVLSWGDTKCIRDAFVDIYTKESLVFNSKKLNNMAYTEHYGDSKLIEMTKEIIKRQFGRIYNHIILTNGATGAIAIALRAFVQKGYDTVVTRKPPFFPLYPTIFETAGISKNYYLDPKITYDGRLEVALMDSPSNPMGNCRVDDLGSTPIIWDAVYHSNVYVNRLMDPSIPHVAMIGSYSKLLGLNGVRIGWIATDDSLLYERLKSLVDGEYAGLSGPSMDLLVHVLDGFDWESFEKEAQSKLDYNREEWSKLERYFMEFPVNGVGMFYYAPVDNKAKKLLEKSGIEWLSGSICHHNDEWGRFNLGADCTVLKAAVKSILKNDRK